MDMNGYFYKAITKLYTKEDIEAFELFATLMHDLQKLDQNGTFVDAIDEVISGESSIDEVLAACTNCLDNEDDVTYYDNKELYDEYRERISHIYEVLGLCEVFDY